MRSWWTACSRRTARASGVIALSTLLALTGVARAADNAAGSSANAAGSTSAAAGDAAPAPSGGSAAAGAAAGAGSGDSGAYTVRLRSLEKNVNELKEQIFRTKARINLLKETVLGGVIGASRALIRHKNEMGSSYRLIQATYALDGVQIFSKADESGRLSEMTEFDVYNGAIQPGSHTLSVVMLYQGNGFGVFSYLKGYKFKVRSSYNFVAGEAKTTGISVVGYEKGNLTTDMNDRPQVDFRVNVMAAGEGAPTASDAKK
jgi:hypothetical protein